MPKRSATPERKTVRIFVVEDDPVYLRFIQYVLGLNPDYEVTSFQTAADFLARLNERPDVVTLDYSLPDMTGEAVLRQIVEFDPDIAVIIVSAQEKIQTAVKLLKAGAFDYIPKDKEAKELISNSVQNALQRNSLIQEIGRLKEEISARYEFSKTVIGSSPAIREVFTLMEKAAKTNIVVTITGETGTGKELVARAIHYNSDRKKKPFIAVNIAGIPRDLLESELFGHEKGSFTGASARRIGRFEEAQGGTLLLDEIGEMDINLQAKLLRVLQEKEVTRVGGNEVIKLDVRIIVATNRDLEEEVHESRFRKDLYYRLLGLRIHLPALRDRRQDIVPLAKHFLDQYAADNKIRKLKITEEAQDKLRQYSFPGNIRELKSVMDLAAVMADDGQVDPSDITFSQLTDDDSLFADVGLTLQMYTYRIIRSYLNKYKGDIPEVARQLDISRATIYRYLKEMENAGI